MELVVGRVIRSQSGHVVVHTDGGLVTCSVRGRLKKERKAKTDLAVIGDIVRVRLPEGVIESVEPRRNRFARRQPGKRGVYKEDVLVANGFYREALERWMNGEDVGAAPVE